MNVPAIDVAATGQVNTSAADVYDDFFVPALFEPWPEPVCDAARVGAGQTVLDTACGTGVLAREALRRVAPSGSVVGLDRNDGMLAVASRVSPGIDWRAGRAEEMPFDDARFDAVVSQFGLMFFDDRVKGISEMWRVLRPGGRLAVAVWDKLENCPGYLAMARLLRRLFGADVAEAIEAPYALGETTVLKSLFRSADVTGIGIETIERQARFGSLDAWLHTDVKGWTLGDLIDDRQYEVLRAAARDALRSFEAADGSIAFAAPAHIVTAHKV